MGLITMQGRFQEEQEIIDSAMAAMHETPRPVRIFISHFLRNDMTSLQRQCLHSQEALEVIQHMSRVLKIIGM